MKPTTKQIAKACGMSYGAVKKWPLARRERLANMIEQGGCPQVADLLADVQRLCYELSIKLGLPAHLDPHLVPDGFYSVYHHDARVEERTNVAYFQPLTIQSLQTTILKLEEMINGA